VARFLAGHAAVARTFYPGLPSHPQHNLAQSQMSGSGNMVSFEARGGKDHAFRILNKLALIDISNNLGDAKSLITHPATTTHQRLTAPQRAELGITDGLLRISVGLEHPDDIVEDVLTALEAL